jgi:hypothetical protein
MKSIEDALITPSSSHGVMYRTCPWVESGFWIAALRALNRFGANDASMRSVERMS